MPTEIIAALLGALVGAWITYRFSLGLIVQNKTPCKPLPISEQPSPLPSLLSSLLNVTSTPMTGLMSILISRTPFYPMAPQLKCSGHFSKADRSAYQKAWEEYQQETTKDIYDAAVEPRIEGVTVEEFIENKINNILKHAG